MKKHFLLSIVFTFFLTQINQVNAQVSTIPFTAALDSFAAITGTVIDTLNADDVNYIHIPIGFNFDFDGSTHSEMSVNNNGYIQLDSIPVVSFSNILGGNTNNRIAPFGADLINKHANASLQYATIGTSPNRICIIQWLHYSYFGSMIGDVSFQIRLHETSNCISFVYGANAYAPNNLNTQIGIRGNSNSSFVVLGDTTCNWADAYPFSTINTVFPVSLSCSMPSGFAFHFGACVNNGGIRFSYLNGNVFNDINGNGLKDISEVPIKNQILNINPGNYYLSSDGNGDYSFFFFDSTITYTITTTTKTYWTSTTPTTLNINPFTQSCSGNNFGFQIIPNIHEMSIHCPAWGVKPAQVEPMLISYQNNGTSTESDTITFVMDSLYSFVSSNPAPLSVNGQIITWVYPPIAPGSHGNIMLMLLPDSSGMLGNYMNSVLSIGPFQDTIPLNNTLNLHQLITLAWDPNEKLAEPSGLILSGTPINYTIHFQNTGNAIATNVTVKDTLDTNLDLMSFELLGSSHPVNFNMSENGLATFTFFNIQLPDSGSDLANSNGYVSYRVNAKNNLAPLTVINNRAGIIFDWNPSVLTNTTSDTIDFVLSVNQNNKQYIISASPNPSNGNVVFHYSDNNLKVAKLKIISLNGQLVFQKNDLHSYESVDLSNLAAGVYSALVEYDGIINSVKIIKE